ncbi:uncharacterized protein LOC123534936 [Mercenaria mercenaria]|uniref:uncharacterized protein LOC123534936 n=1 Tax=Mercenaria mercenaria TaxID=6596 RepID=UPI00234F9687|nr:uncharacterized protein LOC123534936 [Mercenaria mercenaria]
MEFVTLSQEGQEKQNQGGEENTKRMYALGPDEKEHCPVQALKLYLSKCDPNAEKLFCQHKPIIPPEHMIKIHNYLTTTSNPITLRYRIWFILSVQYVSRGLEFHPQLNKNSLKVCTDENGMEFVTLSQEGQEKQNQGGEENTKRMYALGPDEKEHCPVQALKLYLSKCDPNAEKLFCQEKSNTHSKTVQTFISRESTKGKPYSGKLREIYYYLLSLNVGVRNIGPVIKKVLTLVDWEVSGLPSVKTVCNFNTELGVLAKKQVNEKLKSSDNLTVHRDATTKKGKHYYGMEISTETETLTAGIKEVHNGKAETYVSTIDEIMNDISFCSDENSDHYFYNNVRNCMTDRCATEGKVNNLMKEKMSNDLNEFKCTTHPILQFSEICEKEIQNIEKENKFEFDIDSQCSFNNILKSVSKLFFKDGSGDPLLALNYLKSKGIKTLPLINFRGNRFNTSFYNSAGVYYIKDLLLDYLRDSKSSLNYIQTTIVKCLNNKCFLSILRAMGILDKIVTEPYFSFTTNTDNNILEMTGVCSRLLQILNTGTHQPDLLLNRRVSLFFGPEVERVDAVSTCLFKSSETDSLTCKVLSRLYQALHDKCQRIFKDYLPDGKMFFHSEKLLEDSKSCPRLMAKSATSVLSCEMELTPTVLLHVSLKV